MVPEESGRLLKEQVGKPKTIGSQISSYYSENGKAVHVGKGLTEVRSLNRRTQTGHAGSGKKRANLTTSDSRKGCQPAGLSVS